MKIFGGLGNQMFQYAAGLALARKNQVEVKLDLSFFEHSGNAIVRAFGLQHLNISLKHATEAECEKYNVSSLFQKLQKIVPWYKRKKVQEPFYQFTSDFFNIKNDQHIDGYWQSEYYFSDIKETILKEFTLKNKMQSSAENWKERILKNEDSVSLHVRRGDYVESKEVSDHIGAQPLEYYYQAIEELKKEITNPQFFVFSDDIEWVKEHLKIDNVEFVSDSVLKDYEEMYLMIQCAHNIIANSSFSWWGAWLNTNTDKIVIAPKVWFADGTVDTKDLIPQTWIRI